jgi:GTPase SAR1 family protein
MKKPGYILVVLGPRSCGKTATMMSYFAHKQEAVYIDCRTIDASTPKLFAYALIEQLLPKIPQDTAQKVLAVLPELAWKLVTGMTFVGRMGATTSEDVTVNLAGLNKLMEKSDGSKSEKDPNDVFKALRCATYSLKYRVR